MVKEERTERACRLVRMPIWGNAHSDQPLFELAHAILMDREEPLTNHAVAIRMIDETMGEESPKNWADMCDAISDYQKSFNQE